MTESLIELGRRAVACKGWRWMPGIAFLDGGESWRVASARHAETIHADRLPDLTDAATLGCLLSLVREAHSDPTLSANYNGTNALPAPAPAWPDCCCWWAVFDAWGAIIAVGPTEAAALVAALEAMQ